MIFNINVSPVVTKSWCSLSSVYWHQNHIYDLHIFSMAVSVNFSLVHCMKPVYSMQCGCMQRAHQCTAKNHKEHTQPDTSTPDCTANTLCCLVSLRWWSLKRFVFSALVTYPDPFKGQHAYFLLLFIYIKTAPPKYLFLFTQLFL